ncbi:elicitin-like protein RAL7A [Phytophthora cinnamomi]|uniref:elicitin-like protein RAL7A n=1 Tax=Phytophthora cinnamomi TaxID=4785 RepID=UPI003559B0DB|nr:elicitin-like protein RAL7A [Phytophthora cinnamomi]
MKTFAYATAAAVACLATQSAAYNDTTCPSSEIAKLLALASDTNLSPCQTASGYTFIPPSAYPTTAQVKLMCVTSACYSLIADLLALDPSDCVINFGVPINVLELAESFKPNCTALGLSA